MQLKIKLSNFTALDFKDWNITSDPSGTMLLNRCTNDQFLLQTIHFPNKATYDAYLYRSAAAVLNTPRVILPDAVNDKEKVECFFQHGTISLLTYLRRLQCQGVCFSTLLTVLKTVLNLSKKYGLFRIKKNMIRVTNTKNVLVWINHIFSSNSRQFPINQDSQTMINDIFNIFQESNYKKTFKKFRQKIKKINLTSFQKLIYFIEDQITNKNCGDHYHYELNYKQFSKSPQFLKKKQKNNSSSNNELKMNKVQKKNIFIKKQQSRSKTKYKRKDYTSVVKTIQHPSSNNFSIGFKNREITQKRQNNNQRDSKNIGNISSSKQKMYIHPYHAQNQSTLNNKSVNSYSLINLNENKNLQIQKKVDLACESSDRHSNRLVYPEVGNFNNDFLRRQTSEIEISNKNMLRSPNHRPVSPVSSTSSKFNFLSKAKKSVDVFSQRNMTAELSNNQEMTNMSSNSHRDLTNNSFSPHKARIKNPFRDSANSLATTNFFNSINSSGRTKLIEEDSLIGAQSTHRTHTGTVESFGSNGRRAGKLQNRFTVKASKIISEHSEDVIQNSCQKGSQFDIERDLDSLLMSDGKRSLEIQKEMLTLEMEMKNILDEQ